MAGGNGFPRRDRLLRAGPHRPDGGTGAWPPDGSQVSDIVQLDVYTQVTDTGNSTVYLVPPEGVVVLSGVGDVLRVTKICQPSEGLLNSFARDFVPWLNLPQRFYPDQPYQFLATTPELVGRDGRVVAVGYG